MNTKIAYFVDDDEDFLALIQSTIQHPHFTIQTTVTENGYHAIDGIIQAKPDVIFMDFYMPKANGSQILPILRCVDTLSHTPIYLISGFPKEDILLFLQQAGVRANGILIKDSTLKSEIQRILDELDCIPAF